MSEAKRTMNSATMKANIHAASLEVDVERDLAKFIADIRRIHYEASIKAGFTPDQALILCMDRSL